MLFALEATWWNFGPHIVYISMFLWVQLDGAFKYSQSSKSSTSGVYILIFKKSQNLFILSDIFLLWNIYSVLFFLFMFG